MSGSRSLKFTVWLLLLIAGGYLLGAAAARGMLALDPDQSGLLLDRGPGKFMRRITMILVIIGLPILLHRYAWKGWRDNGLKLVQGLENRGQDWGTGFVLGLATLGGLMGLGALAGQRVWDPDLNLLAYFGAALLMLLRAGLIGLVEEILARGILFRSLLRLWSLWPAALFCSLIFALGHFLKPQDAAFDQPGLWPPVASMVESMLQIQYVELRVINMTLMSLVLCLIVYRYKTVWFAAGLHAGWVWTKAMGGKVLSFNRDLAYGWLFGRRSDFTDSAVCAIMLLVLLIWAWTRPNRPVTAYGDEPILKEPIS